jgi:hypothetical protein
MCVSHACLLCGFGCGLGLVGTGSDETANADYGENNTDTSFHRFSLLPIIQQAMSSVLEIIDLPDQRHVILHHAFTPLTNVFRGTEAREEPKVVNQMRLVVIPTVHRQSRPIRNSDLPHRFERLLKTPDTTKQLGRHADFSREYLDEPPLAEAGFLRDIPDQPVGVNMPESMERKPHGGVLFSPPGQASRERLLQQTNALRKRGGHAQPLAKLDG